MTIPSVAAYAAPDGVGGYAKHIPPIRALLASLPDVQQYTTYPGGFVLKLTPTHYVAVLMQPIRNAEDNLITYLAETFDGDWETFSVEAFGAGASQVVAWHLTPPWAD